MNNHYKKNHHFQNLFINSKSFEFPNKQQLKNNISLQYSKFRQKIHQIEHSKKFSSFKNNQQFINNNGKGSFNLFEDKLRIKHNRSQQFKRYSKLLYGQSFKPYQKQVQFIKNPTKSKQNSLRDRGNQFNLSLWKQKCKQLQQSDRLKREKMKFNKLQTYQSTKKRNLQDKNRFMKLNQTKDKFIMRQKQILQNQFKNNKQIPIHHTHYYLNMKNRSKTEPKIKDQRSLKANQKIKNLIQELFQQQISMDEQLHQQYFISFKDKIKGQHIQTYEESPNFSKSIMMNKKELIKSKYKNRYEAESQKKGKFIVNSFLIDENQNLNSQDFLCPWNRNQTRNDFQNNF